MIRNSRFDYGIDHSRLILSDTARDAPPMHRAPERPAKPRPTKPPRGSRRRLTVFSGRGRRGRVEPKAAQLAPAR